MIRPYLLVGLLILLGLFGVYLLIPNQKELAYMTFKDKRFEQAKTIYEQELAQGDLTVTVVVPLSKLYLQYGEVNKAVDLLERFLQQNPNHLQVMEKLGVYYQYAQRPEDYERNLEALLALAPSLKRFRELADIYSFQARHDKQIVILQQLIAHYPQARQAHLDLARLLAAADRFNEADQVLRTFAQRHPNAMEMRIQELHLNILLRSNQFTEALARSQMWLKQSQDKEAATLYLSLFQQYRRWQDGWQLGQPFIPHAHQHPPLLVELIQIQMVLGQEDQAYQHLVKLHQQQQLPDAAHPLLLQLALKQNRTPLVIALLKTVRPEKLPSWLQQSALRYLLDHKQEQTLRWLWQALLKTDFPQQDPALITRVAYHLGEKQQSRKWLQQALATTTLPPIQRLDLAWVAHDLKEPKTALEQLNRLSQPAILIKLPPRSVAALYVAMKRSNQGWKRFNTLTKKQLRHTDWAAAWNLLALHSNRRDALARWLQSPALKQQSSTYLQNIYYGAMDRGWNSEALTVAQALAQRESRHHMLLLYALQQAKQPKALLKQLNTLQSLNQDQRALKGWALRLLAKERGIKPQLITFLKQQLNANNLPPQERENIAHELLKLGARQLAEAQFYLLADKDGPDGQHTRALIYLWGPRPDAKAMAWLKHRLQTAPEQQQPLWMDHLLKLGGAEYVVAFFTPWPLRLPSEAHLSRYLSGLKDLKDHRTLRSRLTWLLNYPWSAPFYAQQAVNAQELEHPKLALRYYTHAMQESKALKALLYQKAGELAYQQRRYKQGRKWVEKGLFYHPRVWTLHRLLGDVLEALRLPQKAQYHFRQAMKLIPNPQKLKGEARIGYAHLLWKTGQPRVALPILERLLRQHPNHTLLRLDLADLLLQLKQHKRAREILRVPTGER
ncbi:tetratricopeptide repeat protein [Magnetococcus sp. PR-3]|uniref:tetratricopeptide repeat protein n=1 Tax=Magnetococcus sp. PR-3 TaxID=3120355 RepID=UPI002FCE1D11